MNIIDALTTLDSAARDDLSARLKTRQLRYGAIALTSRHYDFDGDTFDVEGDAEHGWCVATHQSVRDQLEGNDEIELPDGSTLTIDEDGDIAGTAGPELAKELGLDEDDFDVDVRRGKPQWDKLVAHFDDIDPVIFDEDGDEDPDAWMPMYNRAWPIPGDPPDNWHRYMNNMTVVLVDGEPHIALTGCGMDFSWEIADTYIQLGYFPPACIELPRMSGRSESDRDKAIIEACCESQRHVAACAARTLQRLEAMLQS